MPGAVHKIAKQAIKTVADSYRAELSSQISNRVDEMRSDNNSHFLLKSYYNINI